jgi:hypothetical protein
VVLDQRRAALHPVAVVAVEDSVDLAHLGVVDVSRDHAVQPAALGLVGEGLLELTDEVDRVLDPVLQVRGERPVGQAQAAPSDVEPVVQVEAEVVGAVAEPGQPLVVLDDAVELVAVADQQTLAVGRRVDDLALDGNAAEHQAHVAAQRFVVVPWNVDDLGAVAGLAHDCLHHATLALVPVGRFAQPPAVDHVADQVEPLAAGRAEEVEQELGLAPARAQVQV